MKKYQAYIIKKHYLPIQIDAEDANEAEAKGYEWINEHWEECVSDDTYVYVDGEITE